MRKKKRVRRIDERVRIIQKRKNPHLFTRKYLAEVRRLEKYWEE